MNYEWLDPLGRVRRQPHWCSHFRVDRSYAKIGSDLRNLHRGGELSEERYHQSQRRRKTDSRYRSTGVHQRAHAITVDRPVEQMTGRPHGRPTDMALLSGGSGRPNRSVDRTWVGRPASRPTNGAFQISDFFSELETSPIEVSNSSGSPWL